MTEIDELGTSLHNRAYCYDPKCGFLLASARVSAQVPVVTMNRKTRSVPGKHLYGGHQAGASSAEINRDQNPTKLFSERLKEKRNELGWSQKEAANNFHVDLRSYQYWETGEKLSWVTRLTTIAQTMGVSVAYFFDEEWMPSLRLRDVEDIVRREACCSDFWVMKTGKRFLGAQDPATRGTMFDVMLHNKVNFHFVFAAADSGLPGDACASFEWFYSELEKHGKAADLRKHVEGLAIPDETTAFRLGLCDDWMAFVLAQYNAEGRRKFGRPIDVWIEFARAASKGPGRRSQEGLWIELDPDEARSWQQRRDSILKALPKYPLNKQ